MRFKHTFHVFVDNFTIIYKQLLYRLVILLISGLITFAVVYPFIMDLINSDQLQLLLDNAWTYLSNLLNGKIEELGQLAENVKKAFGAFMELLQTKLPSFVLSLLLLVLVRIVSKWFEGLGNYATAACINDKMALRAKQPFLTTLIKNLKDAAIYNLIYVPMSVVYDVIVAVAMFFLLFFLLNHVLYFLICVFLFTLALVFSIIIKMTFTTDWLPSLIRGKKGQRGAFLYTFSRNGKNTLHIMSDFAVLVILIFALNVTVGLSTLGVGLLLTIPSSYVCLICFEFVNYYDREGLKYFIGENNIVSTKKERDLTREEFFRGENDET